MFQKKTIVIVSLLFAHIHTISSAPAKDEPFTLEEIGQVITKSPAGYIHAFDSSNNEMKSAMAELTLSAVDRLVRQSILEVNKALAPDSSLSQSAFVDFAQKTKKKSRTPVAHFSTSTPI